MKKVIVWALLLGLLFSGCASETPALQAPVSFYYCRSGSVDGIGWEVREGAGLADDPAALLDLYLAGPADSSLISPFPAGVRLEQVSVSDDTLIVTLSPEFAQLQGIDLTVACACLTLTALECSDCTAVRIGSSGEKLNGNNWIRMTRESLMLTDNSSALLKTTMTLYYVNPQSRGILGLEGSITPTSATALCTWLMEQLMDGRRSEFPSPLPEGTRLLGVSLTDGLCTVNFSSEFEKHIASAPTDQYLTLQSIVNTMTQVDGVTGVHFYCNGTRILHYGTMDTRDPWAWNATSLCSGETAARPIMLYARTEVSEKLVAIPAELNMESTLTSCQQVVAQLSRFHGCNGFRTQLPPGTLPQVTLDGAGVCLVDLPAAYMRQEPKAVESGLRILSASLYGLTEVNRVEFLVDGAAPAGDLAPLFEDLYPEGNWFA